MNHHRMNQEKEWVPYLEKTRYLYLVLAIISLLVVFFFNGGLTRFFMRKSLTHAMIIFFLLPLLALITRPLGKERAIGFIYAIRKKHHRFWISTLMWWGIGMISVIMAALILLSLKSCKIAAGLGNWIYIFSFLVFLVNLVPEPPPPPQLGRYKIPVGLWGPPASGKTVFLGMLQDNLHKKWHIILEPETSQYLDSIRKTLMNEKWPEKTPMPPSSTQKIKPLVFHFLRPGTWYPYLGYKPISIEVPKVSGKLFADPTSDDFIKDGHAIFSKLALSAGLFLMIDHHFKEKPNQLQSLLKANLDRILQEYDPSGTTQMIPFPAAVIITKVDDIYSGYRDPQNEPPEKLFSSLFGQETITIIKEKIRKPRIFCISSIGINEKGEPRTHPKDGSELPGKELEPFGLFEPLEWLLIHSQRYALKEKIKKFFRSSGDNG